MRPFSRRLALPLFAFLALALAPPSVASDAPQSFDIQGYTNTGFCAIGPMVGQCSVVSPGRNWEHDLEDLGGPGTTQVTGPLTWNPDSLTAETFLVVLVGEVDGQPRVAERASGTTPLTFAFDTAQYAGDNFGIHIHALHRQDASGVILTQEFRENFHLTGTVA